MIYLRRIDCLRRVGSLTVWEAFIPGSSISVRSPLAGMAGLSSYASPGNHRNDLLKESSQETHKKALFYVT